MDERGNTLNSLIKKRKLWKKFKYCKSPLNKSNYDEAKRSANYHVRQAKYEYERSIATNMEIYTIKNKIQRKYPMHNG
jgi:AAA15 family ATPase/GTPase